MDVDLCGHVEPLVSLTGWPRWIFEIRQVAVSVFRVASACAFLQDDLNRGLLLIVEKLLHRARGGWSEGHALASTHCGYAMAL